MMHPTEEMMSVFERRITFDVSELPELKDWKLGGMYTLTLDVVQESRHEQQGEKMQATFVIKKVAAMEEESEAGLAPIIGLTSLGGQDK